MSADQQVSQWGQIVTKASQDDNFRKRLLAEPATTMQEFGFKLPDGVQLRVLENTDEVVYLTLPAKPREGELSDADLEGVAGGLVVIAIIAILMSPFLPDEPDMSKDQMGALLRGQPMPRPR
jgi:hypothetical protein